MTNDSAFVPCTAAGSAGNASATHCLVGFCLGGLLAAMFLTGCETNRGNKPPGAAPSPSSPPHAQTPAAAATPAPPATVPSPTPTLAPTPAPKPPVPPRRVEAKKMDADYVALRWSVTEGVEKFMVLRAEAPDGDYFPLGTFPADDYTFTDDEVEADTDYWYKVRAIGTDGLHGDSTPVKIRTPLPPEPDLEAELDQEDVPSMDEPDEEMEEELAEPDPEPPVAPEHVSIVVVTSDRVTLAWDDSPRATRFLILRSDAADREFKAIDIVRGKHAYTDRYLNPDTPYWYCIRAMNEGPTVDDSHTVMVRTKPSRGRQPRSDAPAEPDSMSGRMAVPPPPPPPAPQSEAIVCNETITITESHGSASTVAPRAPAVVRIQSRGDTWIRLMWSDTPGATSFLILRATHPNGPFSPVDRVDNEWEYRDTRLRPGTDYYYIVRAEGSGEGWAETPPVLASTTPAGAPPDTTHNPPPAKPTPRPSPAITPAISPTPDTTAPVATRTPRPTRPPHKRPTPQTTAPVIAQTPPPTPVPTPEPTPTPTPVPTPVFVPTPEITPPPTPVPTEIPQVTPYVTPYQAPYVEPAPPPPPAEPQAVEPQPETVPVQEEPPVQPVPPEPEPTAQRRYESRYRTQRAPASSGRSAASSVAPAVRREQQQQQRATAANARREQRQETRQQAQQQRAEAPRPTPRPHRTQEPAPTPTPNADSTPSGGRTRRR